MELTCKRFLGEYITQDRWILDQIADEDNQWYWSGKGSFRLHLENDYGITQEQYWNIIHGIDMDYKPTCPVCGTPVNFHRMSHGGWRKYCSVQCTGANHETYKARFRAYGYEYARIYIARIKGNDNVLKLGISGSFWRHSYKNMQLGKLVFILGSSDIDYLLDVEQKLDDEFCIEFSELFHTSDLDKLLTRLIELSKERSTTSLYDVQGNVIDLGNVSLNEAVKLIKEEIV